jgi:pyruvate,orthophosphate dikinase
MKPQLHWPKQLYLIADGQTLAPKNASREHMGSKAYNLLRMAQLDLPVPPALVIGTHYTRHPEDCMLPVMTVGLPELEKATGQRLGDPRNPLIVSVRSGAPVSMPGMMETLLNIGLCDATVQGLLRQTGNPRMVWDAYRRLVASYGEIVAGLPGSLFEEALTQVCQGRNERELDFRELRELTQQYLALYAGHARRPFPQDVNEQLGQAIRAVFASWHAPKAQEYRRLNKIDADMGTAVTVQRMVFGNTGSHSGAGVGFTRDPSTGTAQLWVDFLVNAQGEDVVSGRRNAHGHDALASVAPQAWHDLEAATRMLEREFGDMQDFEFTVQDGTLFMLQTRTGKRTPLAAARIALDLLDAGLIDATTAIERTRELDEQSLGTIELAATGTQAPPTVLAEGMSACTGVVSGEIALDGERAAARAAAGAAVILLRKEAETADIAALESALGLLTQTGARTSHAAVVARQLGKVCLVGCSGLQIDLESRSVRLGELTLREGDVITLDGNQGRVYPGQVATVKRLDEALIARWHALLQGAAHDKHKKHSAA